MLEVRYMKFYKAYRLIFDSILTSSLKTIVQVQQFTFKKFS